MNRLPRVAVLVLVTLAATGPSSAGAVLIWTDHWSQTDGFYGPPVGGHVLASRDAFGAASTMDDQVTDINLMPSVGKTQLRLRRDPVAAHSERVGAVFEREFTLTEDAFLRATATVDGSFVATGTGWLGPLIDTAFTLSAADVVGTSISAVAFRSTPNLSATGQGTYPFSVRQSSKGFVPAGHYTFVFSFDSGVELGQGPSLESLSANVFDTHTANLWVVAEPPTLALAGIGIAALGLRLRRRH